MTGLGRCVVVGGVLVRSLYGATYERDHQFTYLPGQCILAIVVAEHVWTPVVPGIGTGLDQISGGDCRGVVRAGMQPYSPRR